MTPTQKPTKRPKRYKADRLDDSSITPEIVAEWWAPRYGDTNPQRLNNPLWEWLVLTRMDAYNARDRFGYPSPFDESNPGPAWCFARFGQSVTPLPDGRIVMIAGEHEDGYDPDFRIYNDVTVQHPDGSLDLYSYPKAVFPPTDFHTATLAGDRIIIIGSLGYRGSRTRRTIPVAELELQTWSIRMIETHGESPGWLHKHRAQLSDDGQNILVWGGLIEPVAKDFEGFCENPDDWSLDLITWQWKRLSAKAWSTYTLSSNELRSLPIFGLQRLSWEVEFGLCMSAQDPTPLQERVPITMWDDFQARFGQYSPHAQETAAEFYQKGFVPDLDVIRNLYRPPVPHQDISEKNDEQESEEDEAYDENSPFDFDEDDYSRTGDEFEGVRIAVQGVTVRYKEDSSRLMVVVEGTLPEETVTAILDDLVRKMEFLLRKPMTVRKLSPAEPEKRC